MLQFFDDLPNDRWAAFLHVERHARHHHLSGDATSPKKRRLYLQMVLVAAHELQLYILPEWQSMEGLLYRLIGPLSDELFVDFERELMAMRPKLESLAGRGCTPRGAEQNNST